jgi:hypothetical protein
VQIAEQIGVSQMHVSRLIARALATLRRMLLDDTPPDADDGTGVPRPAAAIPAPRAAPDRASRDRSDAASRARTRAAHRPGSDSCDGRPPRRAA